MSIEQKIEGNIGKLFLSGEIDLDGSPEVRENIKDLIDKVNVIEVQLSKVNYIDSSGIAALVEGMQLSKSNSKEFCLTDVSNEVMKVIKLAHLDKIFKIKSVQVQMLQKLALILNLYKSQNLKQVKMLTFHQTMKHKYNQTTLSQKIIKLKKQILASKEKMMTEIK